ncbi:MAG TPA: type II toxin-antitoxin system PemK/MazF family toxin [Candidatus Brocadiia bacterium]|nr:type II toxin-antitoxin system PemK/MazF family toxin [Planctomycetota bacterium]MDO8093214.1 type II toxin-antitoxin system PemK/MazF family toxin [Candidatus Brocadiales bacterium]
MYRSGDIILINFPFTNLIGSKVRPALVIVEKKEDIIVIGVFSKVPGVIEDSWFLLEEDIKGFNQTGLKKRSVIKTEKIAVIHNSIVKKKLGNLPDNIFVAVKEKLRKTLNL